ncbi:Cell surface superoxide dismutase [Cu-Zn] 4 [Oleoguttula sp. CCFEE 5521]
MRFSASIFGLLTLPFAIASDAPVVTNNVVGTSYIATLPDRNDTSVRGAVIVNTNSNATGANVQVSISGLPSEGGPFTYHIHEFPVAPDHNCSSTGAHLDPYLATESPPCDPAQEQKCQVGDLAGKHGRMSGPSYSGNYADLYVSTTPDTPAFVGNRSIVVHYANKTRITCANLTIQGTFSNGVAPSPHASASSRPVSVAGPPTVAGGGSGSSTPA